MVKNDYICTVRKPKYYDRKLGQWMEPLDKPKKPKMCKETKKKVKAMLKQGRLTEWQRTFLTGIVEQDYPLSMKQRHKLKEIQEKHREKSRKNRR